jgi:hypothetical protein
MDRLDLIPVVLWSIRAGVVGETDSSHLPARSRRTRRAERFHAAFISPPGPGHAPTCPFTRRSATRCPGSHAALPDERSFPLQHVRRMRRTVPSHFTRITRCLVRRRSWGSYPSQVYSRNRVVDAVQAPRLNCALATFLSDRAHVSFAPKASASRLIFVGMTGRPLEP